MDHHIKRHFPHSFIVPCLCSACEKEFGHIISRVGFNVFTKILYKSGVFSLVPDTQHWTSKEKLQGEDELRRLSNKKIKKKLKKKKTFKQVNDSQQYF